MYRIIVLLFSLAFVFACSSPETIEKNKDKKLTGTHDKCIPPVSNHSHAEIDEINTTHLHLDLNVDFEQQRIDGIARHTMNNTGVKQAVFDIDGLNIQRITLGKEEKETHFEIGEEIDNVGSSLTVEIDENTTLINIYYNTTEKSNALDWLPAALTGSKKHPFLYTQGQAILTRTWIPIQDTPRNRITYSAKLKVPSELLALMSADNPTEKNNTGVYEFEMNQPIPSYLIALAVGELEYRPLNEYTGVYAEPKMIQKAADEFEDIPKMFKVAQNLYGKYLWDKYDVIVLPNSFPFGGMENPRLTFTTPTLISGDKSLVSVIAHELAHSWSGNLVTNATWNDLWLNEGFTVYFENRIMENLYGKEVADMLMLIEYQELVATVDEMMTTGKSADTHLKLNLDCRNPDDGLTDIAYVKGALFLKTVEEKVGRNKMDKFLKTYFKRHQFQTLTTEDFLAYFDEHLIKKYDVEFNTEEWVYGDGIPDNCVEITSPRFERVQKMALSVKQGNQLPEDLSREDYTTQEWLAFIRKFGDELSPVIMRNIDHQLNFKGSGNAEIMTEWFVLGIESGYHDIFPQMEDFLTTVGRRKFLKPIYHSLSKTKENLVWAREVYAEARPNYHAVSFQTIDQILDYKEEL